MYRKYVFSSLTTLIVCVSCSSVGEQREDLSIFLKPTRYIDSDHPDIVAKATELTKDCETEVEKAKALYEYVRDSHNMEDMEYSLLASKTLKNGGRGCFDSAVLLATLCRSVGIPARLHIQKVTLKNRRQEKGEWVDSVFLHGIIGIYINGEWHLYDTDGFPWKWVFWARDEWRASEMPLEFYPDGNCLFRSIDKAIFETLPVYFVDWYGSIYGNLDEIFAGMLADDMTIFLKPGSGIDSDHPKIVQKAKELTKGCKTDAERAKNLYEFVRDSYNDNPSASFKASDVLDYGGNNCIRRATLLAALCRAVKIPARLHIQEFTMIDYKLPDGEVQDLRSPHVITGIFLDGNWRLYDATGNAKKWIGLNQDEKTASEMPLDFHPDRDCLFQSNDKVRFTKSLLYFADWSDAIEEFKNQVATGEIGVYYNE